MGDLPSPPSPPSPGSGGGEPPVAPGMPAQRPPAGAGRVVGAGGRDRAAAAGAGPLYDLAGDGSTSVAGSPAAGDVTRLLERVNAGERGAMDDLLPLVYEELRALAASYLQHERADHTLQPTALVHEAYLRLVDQTRAKWESHGHFLAIAAMAMRRILVNHARDRGRLKRGGGRRRVGGDPSSHGTAPGSDDAGRRGDADDPAAMRLRVDLIALDEALEKLETIDPRKVRIVEARFFVGLTVEQTAAILDISPATVKREWSFARAWLVREVVGELRGDGVTD